MLSTILLPLMLSFGQQAPGAVPVSNEGPVIVTTGEGVVKAAPDRVWITIAAESRAKSPKEAQRANADAMKAVLDKLKGLGLAGDAIRTSGYDLAAAIRLRQRPANTPRLRGAEQRRGSRRRCRTGR